MPDETIAPSTESGTLTSQSHGNSIDPFTTIAALLSAAIVGFFFLPWGQVLGIRMTAFQLQTLSPKAKIIWLIPAFAFLCFCAAITNRRSKGAERFAGLIPFMGLAYALYDSGTDFFQLMDVGAYLTLIVSAVLIILPAKR